MARRRRSEARRAADWGGRRAQALRKQFAPAVEAGDWGCCYCNRPIVPGQSWDLDHSLPRDLAPESKWDVSLLRPAHSSCNRSVGAAYGNRKRAQGLVPRRPSVLCAGCASAWVSPEEWLCRECALVVAGA